MCVCVVCTLWKRDIVVATSTLPPCEQASKSATENAPLSAFRLLAKDTKTGNRNIASAHTARCATFNGRDISAVPRG